LVSLVVSFSFMFVELASMMVESSCCCWVLWRTCWYLWRYFLWPTFHQGCDGSVGHSPAVDYLFTSLPQGGSDEFFSVMIAGKRRMSSNNSRSGSQIRMLQFRFLHSL
jgi:hypothetical protein